MPRYWEIALKRTETKPSAAHMKVILDLNEPGDGKELMPLLELSNDFSDFLDHFTETVKPQQTVLHLIGLKQKKNETRSLYKIGISDWVAAGALHGRFWRRSFPTRNSCHKLELGL